MDAENQQYHVEDFNQMADDALTMPLTIQLEPAVIAALDSLIGLDKSITTREEMAARMIEDYAIALGALNGGLSDETYRARRAALKINDNRP